MKLFESPDTLTKYTEKNVSSNDAFVFLFVNNKLYLDSNREYQKYKNGFLTHYKMRELYPELKKLNVSEYFKYRGRLWYDGSNVYISFWEYPSSKEILKLLDDISYTMSEKYNLYVDPNDFIIEAIDFSNPDVQELIDQYKQHDIDTFSFDYLIQDLEANIYVLPSEYVKLNYGSDLNFSGIDHLKGSTPKKNWGSYYYQNKYPNAKPEDLMRFRAAKVSEALLNSSNKKD